MTKEKYCELYPVVGHYNGYEIRSNQDMFFVDAALAIYGVHANTIEGCYGFIDELVNEGIEQYDNEAVMKYLIKKRYK